MRNPWIDREWKDLCQRVFRSAEFYSSKAPQWQSVFHEEANTFQQQSIPESYPDMLERVRSAAALAIGWDGKSAGQENQSNTQVLDPVEEALLESFPASDPPCWTVASI